MQPHRSNALDGAAAALTAARTRVVAVLYYPLGRHGLGLISLRAARERLAASALRRILSSEPRIGSMTVWRGAAAAAARPARHAVGKIW